MKDFVNRNDDEIHDIVSKNAPVADIFEYVLGIAWYYISQGKVNIRESLKMTLDASLLPLSHAAGYQGDIELHYDNRTVLLEATLMDRSTQKRGELEPVIRHTVNLAVECGNKPEQTIFVASELDNNVVNIFRAASFIELEHSAKDGAVLGVNIFAMSIQELIEIMNKQINDQKIIEQINKSIQQTPSLIYRGWRERIMQQIMA
ncbi:hypothetical protein IV54_GL000355 [Levilactobacillus paucivorans]|uniref:AlwI restriction endonuclease n=1 Tax=Levilactobacillus paucivorans TaxID=616990 RepID=A0A0R2LPD5_9LACO|nr:hypothetical protein IV54_GL000355 [Levilactobacillus paucivorans]